MAKQTKKKANSQKSKATVCEEKLELALALESIEKEKGLRGDTDVALFLLDR